MVDDLRVSEMSQNWNLDPRWSGIDRPYTPEDVLRLRGSIHIEHSLARLGAEALSESKHSG